MGDKGLGDYAKSKHTDSTNLFPSYGSREDRPDHALRKTSDFYLEYLKSIRKSSDYDFK